MELKRTNRAKEIMHEKTKWYNIWHGEKEA